MSDFRFQGGEIVRLRVEREGVSEGCCGIVWGVYASDPTRYEATFVDGKGDMTDVEFESDDVDELSDVSLAPFGEKLLEIRRILGHEP